MNNLNIDISELIKITNELRYKIIEMSHVSKTAHLGSCLSCVDILSALYWTKLRVNPVNPYDDNRDRFVFSKGHAAMAIFSVLAFRGFFPKKLLDTFAQEGSCLEEHPAPKCAPGIEVATGSLGHGLGFGIGMALAAKIKKQNYLTYVLLGDGECNEGEIWEAALFAPAKGLDNIIAIVDFNDWQATGRSSKVMSLKNLKDKWETFGWSGYEIDGHDIEGIIDLLSKVPDKTGKPIAIIANTVKGKGVSFMEDDNNWHYRIPNAEEVLKAKEELGLL